MYKDQIARIDELTVLLNRYNDLYYNQNISEITDKEYDLMMYELEELEKDSGYSREDSPLKNVGFQTVSELKKVKHDHPMLSLAKTTEIGEFKKYFEDKDAILMAKMDGLTVSLAYSGGLLVKAETRGDGITGEDVLHNVRKIKNVPERISYLGDLVIDGECIVTYNNFKKFSDLYKHPRNFASGSLRQLDSRVCADRGLSFVAWKVVSGGSLLSTTMVSDFFFLLSLGFEVVPFVPLKKDLTEREFISVIEEMKDECIKKSYPIDGMVGSFLDKAYGASLGSTAHHPKHSFAFKFYQEGVSTTLLDIEWNTTRSGAINPVAVFEPVEIDGTTVERASLTNVSMIKDLKLGIGDEITVIKANQIIPQITDNLTRSNTYQIPDKCPSCGSPAHQCVSPVSNRISLVCDNNNCRSRLIDKFVNFCSHNGLDIFGLSEKRIEILVDSDLLLSFSDLFSLKDYRDEIADFDRFGPKTIDSILKSIEKAKNSLFENVVAGLNVPGFGLSTCKLLEENLAKNNCTTFEAFLKKCETNYPWDVYEGIGEVGSLALNSYVKTNIDELKKLNGYMSIIMPEVDTHTKTDNKLNGLRFCVTGKLNTYNSRATLVSTITNYGGIYLDSVSSKLDYLISNDTNSTTGKTAAAKKLGVKIITESEFKNLL